MKKGGGEQKTTTKAKQLIRFDYGTKLDQIYFFIVDC